MKDFIYLIIMILFLSPLVAIPLFSGTVIVLKLHEVIKDFWLAIEVRKYKPSTKKQNPDLLSAEKDGFSPNLKITPKELLANHESLTLERVKDIGQVIYPQRYWQFVNANDSIVDKDAHICSLFLQMSFIREFIIKTEPKLWTKQSEEKWVYHCPKGLRKLKPDFYSRLLNQVREKNRHSQFN